MDSRNQLHFATLGLLGWKIKGGFFSVLQPSEPQTML
jgi:hypothetical protein